MNELQFLEYMNNRCVAKQNLRKMQVLSMTYSFNSNLKKKQLDILTMGIYKSNKLTVKACITLITG